MTINDTIYPLDSSDDPRSNGLCLKHGPYNGRHTRCPECAAALAPQAERIESMVLATEPCPDCGSRHHRSCAAPAETAGEMTAREFFNEKDQKDIRISRVLDSNADSEDLEYTLEAFAKQRVEQVERLLPSTFYADRTLKFRINQMIEAWKRAVTHVADLERQRVNMIDNIDTCIVCGKEIPPGPDFCGPNCETMFNSSQNNGVRITHVDTKHDLPW